MSLLERGPTARPTLVPKISSNSDKHMQRHKVDVDLRESKSFQHKKIVFLSLPLQMLCSCSVVQAVAPVSGLQMSPIYQIKDRIK